MMIHQLDYVSSLEREYSLRRLSLSEPLLLQEAIMPPMGSSPASLLPGRIDLLGVESRLIESLLARRLAAESSSRGTAFCTPHVRGHQLHQSHRHHLQLVQSSSLQQQQQQQQQLAPRGLLGSPVRQRLIRHQQQKPTSGLELLSTATSYSLPGSSKTSPIHRAAPKRFSFSAANSSANSCDSNNKKKNATPTIPELVTIPSHTPPELSLPSLHSAKWDRFYIDKIHDLDVISGRGGLSNHHPGNKKFRQVVQEMKVAYRQTETKTLKTDLSRAIVEHICSHGGRFVKKETDGTGRYYVLTKAEARKKTSQALRETKELKWA